MLLGKELTSKGNLVGCSGFFTVSCVSWWLVVDTELWPPYAYAASQPGQWSLLWNQPAGHRPRTWAPKASPRLEGGWCHPALSIAPNLIVQHNLWEIKGLVVKKEQGFICVWKVTLEVFTVNNFGTVWKNIWSGFTPAAALFGSNWSFLLIPLLFLPLSPAYPALPLTPTPHDVLPMLS